MTSRRIGIYCPEELTREQAEARCHNHPCELFSVDHVHRVAEDDDNNQWIGTVICCYNPQCGGMHPG